MRLILYIAAQFAFAGVFSVAILLLGRRRSDAEVQGFAVTVPAVLTNDVHQWLRPQLRRLSTYPVLGLVWSLTATLAFLAPGWSELPWYWFAGLISMGVGSAAGVLVAAYRTTPLLDGSVRTVDPVRRRLPSHFDRARLLRLRLAVVLSAASLAFAVAVLLSSDTASTRRALVACALGVILVAAYYWVAATLIARPMVASTPEGLLWQKALLARTVETLPTSAFVVAVFSAVLALTSAGASHQDLPEPLQWCSAGLALFILGSAAAAVLSIEGYGWRTWVETSSERPTP